MDSLNPDRNNPEYHFGICMAQFDRACRAFGLHNFELRTLFKDDRVSTRLLTIAKELGVDGGVEGEKSVMEWDFEEAVEMIEQDVDIEQRSAIVLASRGWHQGVIGIVASRLVERFHRPTVMIAIDGDEGKGSARSIPGFHLYDALKECESDLNRYGGHKYAAGLSIAPENIESFSERLNAVSARMLSDDDLVPKLNIDAEIELDSIDSDLVDVLERFAPFGPQNMRPVFVTYASEIVGTPHIVGKRHLKFKVRKGENVIDCIGFNQGDFLKNLNLRPMLVNMTYVLENNYWNGVNKIQIRTKDIRLTG